MIRTLDHLSISSISDERLKKDIVDTSSINVRWTSFGDHQIDLKKIVDLFFQSNLHLARKKGQSGIKRCQSEKMRGNLTLKPSQFKLKDTSKWRLYADPFKYEGKSTVHVFSTFKKKRG